MVRRGWEPLSPNSTSYHLRCWASWYHMARGKTWTHSAAGHAARIVTARPYILRGPGGLQRFSETSSLLVHITQDEEGRQTLSVLWGPGHWGPQRWSELQVWDGARTIIWLHSHDTWRQDPFQGESFRCKCLEGLHSWALPQTHCISTSGCGREWLQF